MNELMEKLQNHHEYELTFEDDKVLWDKSLLLALRQLGYDLKLEDYATRVLLYEGDQKIGEVPYDLKQREPDFEYTESYEVMLLDIRHTF